VPLWPRRRAETDLDVVCVGQISLDCVRVAEPGEPAADPGPGGAGRPREFTGGQAATAALALARLGVRVAWLGAVGDDPAADRALAPLEAAGVDVGAVKRVAGGRTRAAQVRVDPRDGERGVVAERDSRVALAPEDLAFERLAAARVVHVDAEDPTASLRAAELGRAAGAAVVLDADAAFPGWRELVAQSDFPIVSRAFAEEISKGSARGGLLALAARARCLAVVTLGPEGAIACAAGDTEVNATPAFRVEARDTTGAGDAFHAGFIWGLLQGLDAAAVLRAAHAVAALGCTAFGAQGGLPDREALEAFLADREREKA
jgi:sugar/nucleoside kinase (ribokinase family)